MGKSKASKRLKPNLSGEDLDGPSRAKRYALKLFSILPLGLTRVGLSISFGITRILEFRSLDPLVALFTNLMANPQSREQLSVFFTAIRKYLFSKPGKFADHVTPSFQFSFPYSTI